MAHKQIIITINTISEMPDSERNIFITKLSTSYLKEFLRQEYLKLGPNDYLTNISIKVTEMVKTELK